MSDTEKQAVLGGSFSEWSLHNWAVPIWRANGISTVLERPVALASSRASCLSSLTQQTRALPESRGTAGLTCRLVPQGSLTPLRLAYWCLKLSHMFCLELFVCFVTVAKRVNPISVTIFWSESEAQVYNSTLSQKSHGRDKWEFNR